MMAGLLIILAFCSYNIMPPTKRQRAGLSSIQSEHKSDELHSAVARLSLSTAAAIRQQAVVLSSPFCCQERRNTWIAINCNGVSSPLMCMQGRFGVIRVCGLKLDLVFRSIYWLPNPHSRAEQRNMNSAELSSIVSRTLSVCIEGMPDFSFVSPIRLRCLCSVASLGFVLSRAAAYFYLGSVRPLHQDTISSGFNFVLRSLGSFSYCELSVSGFVISS